uniref:phosphoethanolamine N-methyltransferase n=1 Tax=Hucho hucho TaxID=62062 RepID=A0A4W5MEJ2_9TELE
CGLQSRHHPAHRRQAGTVQTLPRECVYTHTQPHINSRLYYILLAVFTIQNAVYLHLQSWLKPGGQVLITDYCCGEKPWTPQFQEYVKQRGYILYTPPQYGKFLQQAGFSNVRAEDRTAQFMQVIQTELQRAAAMKDEFIKFQLLGKRRERFYWSDSISQAQT